MYRTFFPLKKFFLIALSLATGIIVLSQPVNGDYRSKLTGNWQNATSWERFNGTAWVDAVVAPTSSDELISIRNGHTITVNSIVTADQVVVDAGGVVDITFTLNLADGNGNDLVINGTVTSSGGDLNGPGNTIVQAGGALNFITINPRSLGSPVTNNGNMSWAGGRITVTENITIINNSVFSIDANELIGNNAGIQAVLVNNGTITKSGAGQCIIAVNVNNSGIVNLNGGVVQNSAVFTNTGQLIFNTGNLQNNIGASLSFATGSVIGGTGSVTNSGMINLGVNTVFPATIPLTIGTHTSNILGAGNLTINNDLVMQGTISGSGALTINGNITWNNGRIARPLTIDAGRSLSFSTASAKEMEAALTNNGTMTWQEGILVVNAIISVTNNNLFLINSNEIFGNNSGAQGTLVNNGIITKNSGGTTGIALTNFTNNTNAVIKGIGTINLNFPTVFINNGILAPGLSPGILTLNGSGTNPFGTGSTLSIEIAGNGGAGQPNGHDQLQRAGDVTLNGTLNVIETGSVPDGDYTIISLTSGTISGTFSSTNLPANYSVIYNSNNVVVRKGTACPPSVSINASPGNTICAGTNATFSATPTNGGTPSYQWKLNGNNVGTNSSTYSNSALANGDVVTVVMTSSLGCANSTTATSNGITMTVTPADVPSVSISVNPGNTICAGTNVTFTATPTNGGTPSYQWKLNGNNVGINSNTYSNSALANGDVVTVVMTSSLGCASPVNATSNAITMTVGSTVVPSVIISANPGNTICAGTNVTFTASPTNGGTPLYQWRLNGNNVGTNSSTYSNSALVNGDVVTVIVTSSLGCASPTTATSNGITMMVTPTVVPSVSISANPGNTICAGTNVTFTATPTNGGTPLYQWRLNGNNVGTNSATYSNNALVNGDVVTVVMTSSLGCANPANATSNAITMTVGSTVVPGVSISANPGNTTCAGTNVTFTATPPNGGTPSYQWRLNGNNVGTNSATYSNNALVNGDVVTVIMTSSLGCANPANATSNAMTMTVGSTVVPAVSISANPGNTICTGTNVTFTATPTNGGTPSYQWKLNGNNVGTNSSTYSNSALVNGDVITVVMTSSLGCASPTTATSNGMTMTVTPTVVPSVSISANPGITISEGTT